MRRDFAACCSSGNASLLVTALFLALLGAVPASSQPAQPRRTVVLSSSGVDGDHRSWNDYDDRLKAMGWAFDKYANTDLATLMPKLGDYDLLLTTSLWNYGDAQDMTAHIPALRKYLEGGGVVLLTDMSYAPMCDWLKVMDQDFDFSYEDVHKALGARSQLDTTQQTPMLKAPNDIAGFNYWAHYPHWGKKWTVLLRTQAGTALMLGATVGRGALIVTTTFALDTPALQNVYALAGQLKNGLTVYPRLPAALPSPGRLQGDIVVTNLSDAAKAVRLEIATSGGGATSPLRPPAVLVPAHATRTVPVAVALPGRGRFTVTVSAGPGLSLAHECTVPPLLSLRCNRYVFALEDELETTADLSMQPETAGQTRLEVAVKSGDRTIPLTGGPAAATQSFHVAAAKLGPGRWQLVASATSGTEREERTLDLEVRDIKRPPSTCHTGSKGEIIANGKAFFPLGSFHLGANDLATIKQMGFNCTTGPIYGGHAQMPNTAEKAFMDEAAREDVWVLQELSDYVRIQDRNLEDLRHMASELRLQPATLLHYAVDEPSGCALSPDLISRECKLLHECDPDHPGFVQEVPGAVLSYARCGDMAGTDPYPIGSGVCDSFAGVASAVGDTVKAAQGRPVIAVLQGHRCPPEGSKNRYPTPAELRCMSYLVLNHGAKGILFYAWGDCYQFDGKPWPSGYAFDDTLKQAFPPLLAELRDMGMRYVTGDVKPLPAPADAPALDMVTVRCEGKTALVAVNPTSKELDATIVVRGEAVKQRFGAFEVKVVE
jgi:hypothetical protein